MIIAFDPGRNIGVAHVGEDGRLLRCEILDLGALKKLEFPPDAFLVVGNGTGSKAVQDVLAKLELEVAIVNEEGTTLEARGLYFRDHPPRGLGRLLPKGLWSPPRPIDDYAAYAIALRYLRDKGL